MEFRTSPRVATPGATASEVDDLNNILEVERRLVIKTQDNYKVLKAKFLNLKDENELMAKELEMLRLEISEQKRLKEELENLETKSRSVVRKLEDDGKEREMKFQQFRTTTLAELQRVFRKELTDQNQEMQRLEKEKEEIVGENDRLLHEIRSLKTELSQQKNAQKRTESEMKESFSKQMDELLTSLNQKSSIDEKSESALISSLRSKILCLEDQIKRSTESRMSSITEKCERIAHLEQLLVEEKQETARLSTLLDRSRSEMSSIKNVLQIKENDLKTARLRVNEVLKEKLDENLRISERERKLSQSFDEQAHLLDDKLSQLEQFSKTKDSYIEELQKKLNDSKLNETSIQELEQSTHTEREQREKLEKEYRKQQLEMEKKGYENTQKLCELKMERNRLEEYVAELKKRLETSPETVTEVNKLRDQLRRKEDELREMKEHYRELLRRMKTSLTNLEKRHRKTQQKLDNGILL